MTAGYEVIRRGGGRARSPSAPVNTGLFRMYSRFSALWKGSAASGGVASVWERCCKALTPSGEEARTSSPTDLQRLVGCLDVVGACGCLHLLRVAQGRGRGSSSVSPATLGLLDGVCV